MDVGHPGNSSEKSEDTQSNYDSSSGWHEYLYTMIRWPHNVEVNHLVVPQIFQPWWIEDFKTSDRVCSNCYGFSGLCRFSAVSGGKLLFLPLFRIYSWSVKLLLSAASLRCKQAHLFLSPFVRSNHDEAETLFTWHKYKSPLLLWILFRRRGEQEVNQVGRSGQLAWQHGFLPPCLSAADEFTFCSQLSPPLGATALRVCKISGCVEKATTHSTDLKGPVCQEKGATGRLVSFPTSLCFQGFGAFLSNTLVSKNIGSINFSAGHGV